MSITKEQALALQYRDTITFTGTDLIQPKGIKWRVNGKCKTWKRDSARFSLPIKHGLYDYGYLTNENACLFALESKG